MGEMREILFRAKAIKQRRINGKFASNIYDNPELMRGEQDDSV